MTLAELLPHAGAMVLLDRVIAWDEAGALCAATAHLDSTNPLRRGRMLPAICGASSEAPTAMDRSWVPSWTR